MEGMIAAWPNGADELNLIFNNHAGWGPVARASRAYHLKS